MQRFVLQNIRFCSIARENYINKHVTVFTNALYNPESETRRAIIIFEGTYVYIPKCSNFQILRQSYCLHKGRHLLQLLLLVASDGYILDIQGPYFLDCRNNEAQLLPNEFELDMANMAEWIQENDIVIVDQGYRDAIPLLERLGIGYKMPPVLRRGERQLTTQDANDALLVNKIPVKTENPLSRTNTPTVEPPFGFKLHGWLVPA